MFFLAAIVKGVFLEEKYKKYEYIIEEIVSIFSTNTFSFFDKDDIAQQIRSICCNALKYYDGKSASPKTYLVRCVKNRLNNFKRDNYFRYENICYQKKCPLYDIFSGSCVIDGYEKFCQKNINSQLKMMKQKNIKSPTHISKLREENADWTNESLMTNDAHINNIEYKDLLMKTRSLVVNESGNCMGISFDKYIKYGEKYVEKEEIGLFQRITMEVIDDDC